MTCSPEAGHSHHSIAAVLLKRLFLVACCLLQCYCASAVEYPSISYTKKDGLPSNTVFSICQDQRGFIWFATDKGISCFNGITFKNFGTRDGLPCNDIFYFREDPFGRLWMSTFNGEAAFYKDGIIHTAKNTPYLRFAFPLNAAMDIVVNKDSSITFYSRVNPRIYNLDAGNILRHYDIERFIRSAGNTIVLNVQKPDAYCYKVFGSTETLTFDAQGHFIQRSSFPLQRLLAYRLILAGSIPYFVSNSGLFDLSLRKLPLPDHFFDDKRSNGIAFWNGKAVLCTDAGLFLEGDKLLEGNVSDFFKDRNGSFWVSTLDNGVRKLGADFLSSAWYHAAYKGKVVYSNNQAGRTYFGTDTRSIYYTDIQGVHELYKPSRAAGSGPSEGAFYGDERFLVKFSRNDIIVVDHSKGEKIISLRQQNDRFGRSLVYRKDSFLYVVSRTHFQYLPVTRLDQALPGSVLKIDWFKSPSYLYYIFDVQQAPDSTIWYALKTGLYSLLDTAHRTRHFLNRFYFQKFHFIGNTVAGYTDDNKLIVCRDYNGVQPRTDTIVSKCTWDKFFRLTDSSVLISTDDYYRLLTVHASGNYSIRILEHPFLPQFAEYIAGNDSSCFFFRDTSVYKFAVKEVIGLQNLPEVFFRIRDTSFRNGPVSLYLPYASSRLIHLDFDILSLSSSNPEITYAVIKKGQAEASWINANESGIDLFNISPGNYTVRLRAKLFSGRYSEVAELSLHIGPPFWLSWWFILLVLAVIAIVILLVARFYLRRRLALKERENKFLRSEFTALNALMNPHFVFNSLNSVQSLINKEDLEAANQYVRTISDLLRQNMHNISRELIPLKKELELIGNYMKLEKLRFKERLEYRIDIAEDVEEEFVLVPPLLVQPLVENAIKYTLAFSEISTGTVDIAIYNRGDHTVIDVTDNGRGLNAARAQKEAGHESTALGNIRSRLEQLSQIHGKHYELTLTELKDESGMITGTQARISIEW
jgi:hypothetical protein